MSVEIPLSEKDQHSKIISAVAKAALRPLGVQQKGRSRFWYDDGGWFALAIEFQPFRGQRGTALNLGISWLWYPTDYWSFDHGGRAFEFVEFVGPQQFKIDVINLTAEAVSFVSMMRNNLETLEKAFETTFSDYRDWPSLHSGVLAALIGEERSARELISRAYIRDPQFEWHEARNAFCRELLERVGDLNASTEFVEEKLQACRSLRKLCHRKGPLLPTKLN